MLAALTLNLACFPGRFRGSGGRSWRKLGRSLEALEASQARRHLFRSEQTPAHLTVEESVPRRPFSRSAHR
jgi:hypothetical protein